MLDLKFLNALKAQTHEEIFALLTWWKDHMLDHEHGGFLGEMDADNRILPQAPKGIILNTRLLWSFASGALYYGFDGFKEVAQRAYAYLVSHFLDKKNGGLYWMLDHQGQPLDQKKQIYAQAFGIYAFSEYFLLTGEEEARQHALRLFSLIEGHSFDKEKNGYWEAFDASWGALEDLRLGLADQNDPKTMNTHLHILEAYTNLYRIHSGEALKQALSNLIRLFLDTFLNLNNHHLHLFFDEDWGLRSKEISYGHDIEASWLIWEAVEVLGDPALMNEAKPFVLKIAEATAKEGLRQDGAMINEQKANGSFDTDRIWWAQAEAMVGFVNAYELSGEGKYLDHVKSLWSYINKEIKDEKGGEWVWGRREDGSLMAPREKAGPWKAPYHNTRAMIEVSSRIGKIVGNLVEEK